MFDILIVARNVIIALALSWLGFAEGKDDKQEAPSAPSSSGSAAFFLGQ